MLTQRLDLTRTGMLLDPTIALSTSVTPMKIQLLLTGNELMAGHTIDSNSAVIADHLAQSGHTIYRKVTIGDDFSLLVEEIETLSAASDVVIINGGLGPTVDDLTAQALAQAIDTDIAEHPKAIENLQQWCKKRQLKLNEANRKQAMLPAGCDIIDNPIGSAVGFQVFHNNCLVICTPGVPSELKAMLEQSVLTLIDKHFPNERRPITRRFQTFGLGESTLQQLITNHFPDWPEEVELGFRAGLPLLEVKLTIADPSLLPLQQQWESKLRTLIGDSIIGEDNYNLAQAVIEPLTRQGKTLTTAESCTGGLIASLITEIPGSSAAFEAGYITYSNAIKQATLDVDGELLAQHGAVSEAVVLAMAEGALIKSGADYAIAVSGIAGPDGGSEEKPVGTVWMAWGQAGQLKTHRLCLNAGRKWFQAMVAAITLDLIRRELMQISEAPQYLDRWANP